MVRSDVPIHPSRLSLPEVEALWRADGDTPLPECTYDPELHTGPRATIEAAPERAARERVAREVCATCPALVQCGLYALKVRPASGIWAGQTPAEIAEGDATRTRLSYLCPRTEVA